MSLAQPDDITGDAPFFAVVMGRLACVRKDVTLDLVEKFTIFPGTIVTGGIA